MTVIGTLYLCYISVSFLKKKICLFTLNVARNSIPRGGERENFFEGRVDWVFVSNGVGCACASYDNGSERGCIRKIYGGYGPLW